MDKISPIKARILHFIDNQSITKIDFCEKTGISYANLKGKSLKSELGGDRIVEILSIYPEISAEWLIMGNGPMLKKQKTYTGVSDIPVDIVSESAKKYGINGNKPIPYIGLKVAAGFGSPDFRIEEQDVKEYYVVPKFKHRHIDFMIEVTGSSMYPKYNSGDIIACTILRSSLFIQWNKCHVIATNEQGLLVKRIKEGTDKDHILAISDNKEYPPFEIPTNEISGIAIVTGVIRLE